MSETLTIRPAGPADAAAIAEVHVASWRTTYRGIVTDDFLASLAPEDREPRWAESLASEAQGLTIFTSVAEQHGRIIGFADGGPARDTSEFDGEIQALYLLAPFQRQGIGRRLLSALAARLLAAGYRSAVVGVLAANPSRNFYERLGGRHVESRIVNIDGIELEEVFYGWNDLRDVI